VTPSTEITLSKDASRAPPGAASSVRVVAGSAALDHALRCDLGPLDLREYDELRLAVSSNRIADGSPGAPFYLEMRLGSAGLPPGDPGNPWRRLVAMYSSGSLEIVRFSILDLPPSVRSALTRVQIRCTADGAPFTANLASLIAVREEMLGDVDAALKAKLHEQTEIKGALVPAYLHPGSGNLSATPPYFEILNFDVGFNSERTESARPRGDFTGNDYSLRPKSFAYELYYQIAAVADDRASKAQMIELALRVLEPRGALLVNGYALPMEMIAVPPLERIGGARTNEIQLHFRVSTRQEIGTPEFVRAARNVSIGGDIT
jgi:hypothetical protein